MHTNKQKEKQTKAQTFEQSQKLKTAQYCNIASAQSVSDKGGVTQQTMLPNTNSEPGINISQIEASLSHYLNLDILYVKRKGTIEETDQP